MTQDIYKHLIGTGGALVLATVILFQTMSKYDMIVNEILLSHKQDREMYEKTLDEITVQLQTMNIRILSIEREIEKINTDKKK